MLFQMLAFIGAPALANGDGVGKAQVDKLCLRTRLLADDVAPLLDLWKIRERCARDEE